MDQQQHIPLYLTELHPCSYLSDRLARTEFVDPQRQIGSDLQSSLNQIGFRRSGKYVYRPNCPGCDACQSLRVDVGAFVPSRSQRRCLKANEQLEARIKTVPQADHDRYYPLYCHYISTRHQSGDMYPANREQYDNFIATDRTNTFFVEFYLGSQLLLVCVTDQLQDGLSAVYSFYHPDHERRGLGTYAILYQIALARSQGLKFLYLGYWVRGADKMEYKVRFRPAQLFRAQRWQSL